MSPAAGRACSRHYVEEPRHFQDASHEDHDDPRIEPIVECLSCRPVPGCGNRRHRRIHRRRVHFGLMTMRLPTDSVAISLATAGTSDALYRVAFVGGPFDGHMARWGTLPRMCLDLASGPADCGTRVGSTTVRRAGAIDGRRHDWCPSRGRRRDHALRVSRNCTPGRGTKGAALATQSRGAPSLVDDDRMPCRPDRNECDHKEQIPCIKLMPLSDTTVWTK